MPLRDDMLTVVNGTKTMYGLGNNDLRSHIQMFSFNIQNSLNQVWLISSSNASKYCPTESEDRSISDLATEPQFAQPSVVVTGLVTPFKAMLLFSDN